MALFERLFGGSGANKNLTARDGYSLALETLRKTFAAEADEAYLCCIYTSSHDSDFFIEKNGTCPAWHFDFFLPKSRRLYLIRIQKGKVRGKDFSWENTRGRPIEYIYGKYGIDTGIDVRAEPLCVPDDWLDSPPLMASIETALAPYRDPEGKIDLVPLALCLPAEHLRYVQEEEAQRLLGFPQPHPNCFAAICTTDELYEEDCYLLYLDAIAGKVLQTHTFRFPNLFYFGSSVNW